MRNDDLPAAADIRPPYAPTSSWNTSDPEIRKALNDRWEWLDHQAKGSAASKRAAWRDLGDAGLAEDRVRQSYTGRYTIELLQNGHDACADADITGAVWFYVTESALLIGNQGVPFTADRIVSLARLGSSEKARRKVRNQLIGYKGIGFTAVFEIADRPQIISRDVSFCFDREQALRCVSEKLGEAKEPVPARYFPLPLEVDAWKEDVKVIEKLFGGGASSVIRLPFRSGCKPEQVLQDLQTAVTGELLLFAPALSRVEIRSHESVVGWKRSTGRRIGKGVLQHLVSDDGKRRSWLVRTSTVAITADEVTALRDELWKNVRRLNVSAAFPWTASGLDREPPPQPVFAYFPTSDRLGRGILVHGDFYLDEARRRVASSGPQGVVSGRVGDAAAKLVTDLAESLVSEGNRLLACLAPIDRPDGYGEHLAGKLDEALGQAKIVRPADNGPPRRAGELRRLSTKLPLPKERLLMAMLDLRSDLIYPGDDRGRAEELLKRLGCEPMKVGDTASRMEPARGRVPYGSALMLVEGWLKSLEPYTRPAVEALKKRPVVQDTAEEWCLPGVVMQRDPATPPLPRFLERSEVVVPASAASRAFIARLDIGVVTPALALDRLVDYVRKADGLSDGECAAALDFAWKLWEADSSIFENQYGISAIQAPIRTASGRIARGWARADAVYFASAWTRNRLLETLYGPFGKREFLAEEPPLTKSKASAKFNFFKAIGVADRPRVSRVDGSLNEYSEWSRLPDVAAARECPDEHPYTTRSIDCWVIDRLDDLLGRVEKHSEFGRALARALLSLKEPYGQEARIRCTHSAHRHSGGNRATGYQRWRLEQTAWVPVTRHPSGAQVARPCEAWTRIPKSGHRLTLPRVELSHEEAKRLELVDAEAAAREPIETALGLLSSTNSDLQKAPNEVRETAEWLARRLERAIHGKQAMAKAPILPAITSNGYVWSQQPAIADVPGMPAFPDVPLLPPGRWVGLRRAYALPVASALVTHEVELGSRMRVPQLLADEQRAELLALLVRVGAPQNATARRLAILREHTASSLKVRWRSKGEAQVIEKAGFHLVLKHDTANRLAAATLYRAGDLALDNVALGRVIASYLDVPDHEHTVALYLSSRDRLVEQQGLVEDEIAEAQEMLRRKGLAEETEAPTEGAVEDTPLKLTEPEDAADTAATEAKPPQREEGVPTPRGEDQVTELMSRTPASPDGDRQNYIDPNAVRFGAPRKVEATAPRTRREAGRRPGHPGIRAGRAEAGESESPTPNISVEEIAMKIAEQYALTVLKATEVRDVHLFNLGWDLQFHFSDGRWQPVEVKGSSGHAPFVITRNEWRAAREQETYLLIHVTNTGNPKLAAMRIFRGLGQRLKEEHMSSLSWTVDQWGELEPEEIPLEMN